MSTQLANIKDSDINAQVTKQTELVISRFCHALIIVTQSVIQGDVYRSYRGFVAMNGFSDDEVNIAAVNNKQTELESILLAKCFVCVSRINMFSSYIGRDMVRDLECTILYFLQHIFDYLSDDVVWNVSESGMLGSSSSQLE